MNCTGNPRSRILTKSEYLHINLFKESSLFWGLSKWDFKPRTGRSPQRGDKPGARRNPQSRKPIPEPPRSRILTKSEYLQINLLKESSLFGLSIQGPDGVPEAENPSPKTPDPGFCQKVIIYKETYLRNRHFFGCQKMGLHSRGRRGPEAENPFTKTPDPGF